MVAMLIEVYTIKQTFVPIEIRNQRAFASVINTDIATRQVCAIEYVEKGKQDSASSAWQSLCPLLAERMSYALV